jgi:hypothetical protein
MEAPRNDQPPAAPDPVLARRVLWGIGIALVLWGSYLALGTYVFRSELDLRAPLEQRKPLDIRKPLIVLGCVGGFVSCWGFLVWRRFGQKSE